LFRGFLYANGKGELLKDLIFSMNATMPVFFVMVIGYIFRWRGVLSEEFAAMLNRFVFRVALPVNLFHQLCTVDIAKAWDTSYVLFCAVATLLSIGIGLVFSLFVKSRAERGEFIQGAYRSSSSLLGMVYIENIYGQSPMGPLMMIGSVPLYNIMAVIILTLTAQNGGGEESMGEKLKRSLIGIVTNPIILGILFGILWALLRLPMPVMADKTIGYLGGVASSLGLLSLGAMVDLRAIKGKLLPIFGATFLKLVGFAAIFLPMAVSLGYRKDRLVALVIMLGSASTMAGFVMARNMGHKGNLSSAVIMLSTLLSSVTLTFWIYILRIKGYI
jgi:predicted permease